MDDYTKLTPDEIMTLREWTHDAVQKDALNAALAIHYAQTALDNAQSQQEADDLTAALDQRVKDAARAQTDYQAKLDAEAAAAEAAAQALADYQANLSRQTPDVGLAQ